MIKKTHLPAIIVISAAAILPTAMAILLPSKYSGIADTLTPEEISWIEFCRYNDYDTHTTDPAVIDEFLDTWRGSAIEEEALSRKASRV